MKLIRVLFFSVLLTSCEGFKILSIKNSSKEKTKVIVKPGLTNSDTRLISNYPNGIMPDSSITYLEPDSSMTILSIFTWIGFNPKIKAENLRTDYLRIESSRDTITAVSKEEIVRLIYKSKLENMSAKGRNLVLLEVH